MTYAYLIMKLAPIDLEIVYQMFARLKFTNLGFGVALKIMVPHTRLLWVRFIFKLLDTDALSCYKLLKFLVFVSPVIWPISFATISMSLIRKISFTWQVT